MRTIRKPLLGCASLSAAGTLRLAPLMSEALKTFYLPILPILPNVISSPASADGLTRLDSLDGQMSVPFGLARAHANLSARQAEDQGLLMSGTCGPLGSISSISAALQSSLASRLQVKM